MAAHMPQWQFACQEENAGWHKIVGKRIADAFRLAGDCRSIFTGSYTGHQIDAEPACLAGDPAEISEPPSLSARGKRGVACAGGCVQSYRNLNKPRLVSR